MGFIITQYTGLSAVFLPSCCDKRFHTKKSVISCIIVVDGGVVDFDEMEMVGKFNPRMTE